MHKGYSRVKKGIFLGYIWRSTECIIGTAHGIYKCRTVRRKLEETSYDPECIDYFKIHYDDYVLTGAKSNPIADFRGRHGPDGEEPLPCSRDSVPRRLYTGMSDYEKHGVTVGCKVCVWVQSQIGPRANHSEACRERIEKAISEDTSDDRAFKAKERIDHYLA